MDHPAAAIAAASSAGMAGAIAAGWPPDWVLGAALAGGAWSSWGAQPRSVTASALAGLLVQWLTGAAVGLMAAGSWPVIVAVLAGVLPVLRPLDQLPHAVVAGLAAMLAPALLSVVRAWVLRAAPASTVVPTEGDKR